MSNTGSTIGIIGGVMLFIAGIVSLALGSGLAGGLSMLFGILAAICGEAGREATGKDREYIGVCLFVIGLIATIGLFASFTAALIFIDPFLVLFGGVAECISSYEEHSVAVYAKKSSPTSQTPQQTREEALEQSVELQINEGELAVVNDATEACGNEFAYKAESAIDTKSREENDSLSAAQIEALQAEVQRLEDELAFDREVIAAKAAHIAEQAQEIAQLKGFITQVSERVVQPQAPTPSPLPQSNGLCANCGFQNISEAIYCRQCGMKLEKEGEQ